MALSKNSKFDLKLKQNRIFEIGIIVALTFIIAAFKFFPDIEKSKSVIANTGPEITVENIPPTKPIPRVPPPPLPALPVDAPEEGLEEIIIENINLDITEEVKINAIKENKNTQCEEPVIFVPVEDQPVIVGGMAAIHKNLEYPPMAIRAGIQGTVIIKVSIDERGEIIGLEIVKGINGGCDEAALKAVSQVKFIPGKQRGKAVKCQVHIPVRFVIR